MCPPTSGTAAVAATALANDRVASCGAAGQERRVRDARTWPVAAVITAWFGTVSTSNALISPPVAPLAARATTGATTRFLFGASRACTSHVSPYNLSPRTEPV